jgi:hypothetical protein
MSYKFKSLLYFTCFVASALVYYNMERNAQPDEATKVMGMVDTVTTDQHVNEIVHTDAFTY